MARSKRPISNPHAPSRAAIRRRTADELQPEPITRDLNEPPPVSGDNPAISGAPDEGSSKQDSPKAISSPRVSTTSTSLLDTEAMQTEEEERRLEEEYIQRKEAIRKRKEDAERRRREEEERVKKEEEAKRMEEARVRAEKEIILEEERKKAEAELFAENEEVQRKVEEDYQNQYEKFVFDKEKSAVSGSAHSGENPVPHAERKRRVITRSTVAKARKTPTKRPAKQTSRKGKNPTTSLSSSSTEIDGGDEQIQTQNPHHSTVGTEHAPSGVPRQFTSPEVAAHFECIEKQKLKLERGFDPDFVEANSFVKDRIVVHDWSIITAANRRANASLVREFYAEASQSKDPIVVVRGRKVCYNPGQINRVLGRGNPGTCEFSQFLKKMTPACEDLILREIAVEGKPWNKDGQRRCLSAGSLTTEAAVWFQFLRASLSPTSHDTTLSMHKCALLYCILKGKRINVGTVMHAAIDQARTRKKVILPLPCLITSLMIDAGVPSAVEDQWLDATSDINIGTIKKMGRHITTPPPEQAEEIPTVGTVRPTVFIAEEHIAKTPRTPVRPTDAGSSSNQMTEILAALKKINYRLDLMEAEQRYQGRATNSFWMYTRERDEVMGQFVNETNPMLAAQLPTFPEDICATYASGDDFEEDDAGSSPHSTPSD